MEAGYALPEFSRVFNVVARTKGLTDSVRQPCLERVSWITGSKLATENGVVAKFLLNTEQLVVFADTVSSAKRACFDLAGVRGHGYVSYGGILGFAAAV